MRVALVHDDLVQWGGAERVLLGLTEIYPNAPIYTSVCDFDNLTLKRNFVNKKIITSFLQNIPGWRTLYKVLLPLYPIAFEQFDFSEFDLVISHTTRFAKAILTKPQTKHVCFCHTPPRFLWHFSSEDAYGLGEILMTKLRLYDQISSNRVDYFLAGSKNASRRIERVYHRQSKVVYPFIDLERFKNVEAFDGGYMLVISRLNKYKRVDLAIRACLKLGLPLKIIGTGPELNKLREINVEFLGKVNDEMVVEVLAGARALIVCGVEDFGVAALEAQALGKGVIAYREGGALETVLDGKTGLFFDKQDVESLVKQLRRLDSVKINPERCRENAHRFSKENFIKNFQQTMTSLVYT